MNKRVGPTVVMILVLIFILLEAGSLVYVFRKEGLGIIWTIILLIIPFVIIVALISVYMERIKEIHEEEEDDLGKY